LRRVFADTSALYALLVASDNNHATAAEVFRRLILEQSQLIASSYVLVESSALLGRRVGLPGVAAFRTELVPVLEVIWIDAELHERALDLLLARGNRELSLVDAVSFLVMRQQRIEDVFAYDEHFAAEGFVVL
jgi:predicted nucleic acid-binding protein